MESNPFLSPSVTSTDFPTRRGWLKWLLLFVWALLCVYPTIAIGSIYLCCLFHGGPTPSGARVGEFDTLDEVMVTLSFFLIIGIPFLAPLGLLLSLFPPLSFFPPLTAVHSKSIARARNRFFFPALVLLEWSALIALVYLDPGGIVAWYLD